MNLASLKPDVEKPKDLTDTRTATVSSILKADTHPDRHISLLAPTYPIWQEWKRERDRELELEKLEREAELEMDKPSDKNLSEKLRESNLRE